MGFSSSKGLVTMLCICLACPSSAWATNPTQPDSIPISPTREQLLAVDWATVDRLKGTTVSHYLGSAADASALDRLERDLDRSIQLGAEMGIYGDTTGYQLWWRQKRKSILKPSALEAVADQSIAQTAALFYFSFVADTAYVMEVQKPGTGAKRVEDAVERIDARPYWMTATGIAVVGFFAFLGKKFGDAFVFGPVTRVLNSALEPLMKPILERVDQLSMVYISPRMVWWQKLVAGKRSAGEREDVAKAPKLPGTSAEEYARYEQKLWNAFLPSENLSKGAMPKELQNARNRGFDLLYGQYTKLSDRLATLENGRRTLELYFQTILRPKLGNISDADLSAFGELYRWRQDILTYDGALSRKANARDAKIEALGTKWRAQGLNQEQIEMIFRHYADLYVLENRPVFLLTEYLEYERLFPENMQVLGTIEATQMLLERQEIGRQINGVYEELAKHQKKIERLFKTFGTQYDVSDRLKHQGYPYGGPGAPGNAVPVKSCLDLLREAPSQR